MHPRFDRQVEPHRPALRFTARVAPDALVIDRMLSPEQLAHDYIAASTSKIA